MSSTTLYRKYRPQTFAEVVGQKHVVTTLTNALRLGRVGQAYLLTGPRGTGKTTLARLFAKAVNCSGRNSADSSRSPRSSSGEASQSLALAEPCNKCQHCLLMAEGRSLDVIEIDAASHTGVDNIRELRETVNLPPTLGSHKIYIIDEVHMLSSGAFNALLKTLEEPPAHVIFILATTALHKVPDTILSRCQRFDLSRFPVKSIVTKLQMIAKKEKLKIAPGALEMIALTAEGGMRDAESLLMQIISLEASPITEDKVIEVLGTTKKANIVTLLRLIGKRELYASLHFVSQLSQDGADLSIFSGTLLHYLRDLLLVSADPINGPGELDSLTDEQKTALLELATIFSPGEVVRMLEYFQIAQVASKTSVIPELPLQIAIVKILANSTNSKPNDTNDFPSSPAPLSKGSSRENAGEGLEKNNSVPPTNKNPSVAKALAGKHEKKEFTKTATTIKQNKESGIRNQEGKTSNFSVIPDLIRDPENLDSGSATGMTVSLDTIQEKWSMILSTAKHLNASLTLALSTARPIETMGLTVTIAVKYPFHKERLDEKQNQLTLSSAFDTILKTKIKLRIVLEAASPANDSNKTAATKEPAINPLVSQAMDLLGGKLVQEN
ncbi:MAG: DNA polymerase III, subunit gamma and tau [Candidatus Moranbacteria bacterium RIFCSPLOWO2_02_FULL_48_19]|nr:MAG: DNA polymerase III, subunit gamma and tau [Candidatus Moranbacteria bacterium RIFCSPLOWO2_02_FULL_48_19]